MHTTRVTKTMLMYGLPTKGEIEPAKSGSAIFRFKKSLNSIFTILQKKSGTIAV